MKKLIKKTIILTFPIILVVVIINYIGDAARLFDQDFEKKMVEIIINGQNVTNAINYNERLFQKEIISDYRINPDIVVIGSSKTMLISSEQFPNSKFFNNSVSGASIEDIVSIYQIYKDYNKLPKKIIIGIDPWTFNEKNEQTRWKSLEAFYYRFKNSKRDSEPTMLHFKYKELISFSYFQSSIKNLPKVIRGDSKPKATNRKNNKLSTKLIDGSKVYGEADREASISEINRKIASYLKIKMYSIENFESISTKAWDDFEKLIYDMKRNNVVIEIFLSPYAPIVYDRIKNDYPMVLKTEEMIKNFSMKNDIKLYGSFDPTLLGMDETFFYDGTHCKESGIKKILLMPL